MNVSVTGMPGAEHADPGSLFSSAYQEYSPAVSAYLRARGIEDPEAVTQDVFLALYPRLAGLRGGAAGLRTLIFTIAHARAVDHFRRRSRTPVTVEYDARDDPRVMRSAEDQSLESAGTGILSLLANLTDDYREVLALRIIADLSLEATARIMERSPGAVKLLQRRALARLRDQQPAMKGPGRS